MTVIKTKRNRVVTEPPEADDVFTQVGWTAPGDDGVHRRTITLPMRPITEHQALVDWAISVADQFVHPLYVVPISANQFLHTEMFEPYRKMIANMSNEEWGELRQLCIATCAEVMRDCPDREVRAAAYDVLLKAKVICP